MDWILIVLLNIFRQISKCKRGDLVPCGRHPCLLIKREEMMINSEKLKLLPDYYCCDRKFRAACEQSFAPWQQATIEIMFAISLTISCSRFIYYGVILHAHPVRGESHKQRNTTGEVATLPIQYTISQKAQKLFGNNLAVVFLKFSDGKPINQS